MGNSLSWVTQTLCPEEQVLWLAAKSGDLASLQQALARLTAENRAYLEWKDPIFSMTPLAIACTSGHTACVIALLAVDVDVNARDAKGYTPLHLAIMKPKSEVVRLLLAHPRIDVHARTTTKRQTPLDLARYEYGNAYEAHTTQYLQCIEHIEKHLCVYSGWLHQRVDNLLSLASGLSGLNSWKGRYCMVLRTNDANVVEIDLFTMKAGDKRPARPSQELVYKLSDGIMESSGSTWLNRRDHRFSINAYTKEGINRVSAPQTFDFAATSHRDLTSWKTFFGSLRVGVEPIQASGATASSRSANSTPPYVQPSMLDEQRDLERAIQLSREEAQRHSESSAAAAAALFTTPPPRRSVPNASAPPWNPSDSMSYSPEALLAPDGVEIVQPLQLQSPLAANHLSTTPASAFASPAQDQASAEASNECIICFDGPKSTVCVPCGHNAICQDCADHLLRSTKLCPVCRVTVREVVKIYHC